MKFRQAFALLFMGQIYRTCTKYLDALDTLGGMWEDPSHFMAGAFIIFTSVGLCALAWRVVVGKDQW